MNEVVTVFCSATLATLTMILVLIWRRRIVRGRRAIFERRPAYVITFDVRVSETAAVWFRRLMSPHIDDESPAEELAVREPGDERRPVVRFLIDALMLRRSFEYVCPSDFDQFSDQGSRGFREVFHYFAGLRVDDRTFVIAHIVRVGFSQQSSSRVRVEDASNIATLESLDKLGLPLVAHAHSHPGFGAGATHPSGVDRSFQERLERGGHVAVGMIFSRDAYVRFFAGDPSRFVVDVQGEGVERVDENVFRVRMENSAREHQALVD